VVIIKTAVTVVGLKWEVSFFFAKRCQNDFPCFAFFLLSYGKKLIYGSEKVLGIFASAVIGMIWYGWWWWW